MSDTHIAAEPLLPLPAMNEHWQHVAYGAVTGSSHSTADERVVQITAAAGYEPTDWDRVTAALNAHDEYADWDVDWDAAGATIWTITYPKGT